MVSIHRAPPRFGVIPGPDRRRYGTSQVVVRTAPYTAIGAVIVAWALQSVAAGVATHLFITAGLCLTARAAADGRLATARGLRTAVLLTFVGTVAFTAAVMSAFAPAT